MAAASVAALTVYDMVKAIERGVEIERVVLLHKSGGKSGEWNRERAPAQRSGRAARAPAITVSSSRATGAGEDESGAVFGKLARIDAQVGATKCSPTIGSGSGRCSLCRRGAGWTWF